MSKQKQSGSTPPENPSNRRLPGIIGPSSPKGSTGNMLVELEERDPTNVREHRLAITPGEIETEMREVNGVSYEVQVNKPLYMPHGKWQWAAGFGIESNDPGVALGGGLEGQSMLKVGKINGKRIVYISKLTSIWHNWSLMMNALYLNASSAHLRLLQGVCVPWYIGVTHASGGRLALSMDLPHPKGWREADAYISDAHKEKILLAYRKIQAKGVSHGDAQFRHMLIGDDDNVTIIDFGLARVRHVDQSAKKVVTFTTEAALRQEYRKVKFLLNYKDSRERETKLGSIPNIEQAQKALRSILMNRRENDVPQKDADLATPEELDLLDGPLPIEDFEEAIKSADAYVATRFEIIEHTDNVELKKITIPHPERARSEVPKESSTSKPTSQPSMPKPTPADEPSSAGKHQLVSPRPARGQPAFTLVVTPPPATRVPSSVSAPAPAPPLAQAPLPPIAVAHPSASLAVPVPPRPSIRLGRGPPEIASCCTTTNRRTRCQHNIYAPAKPNVDPSELVDDDAFATRLVRDPMCAGGTGRRDIADGIFRVDAIRAFRKAKKAHVSALEKGDGVEATEDDWALVDSAQAMLLRYLMILPRNDRLTLWQSMGQPSAKSLLGLEPRPCDAVPDMPSAKEVTEFDTWKEQNRDAVMDAALKRQERVVLKDQFGEIQGHVSEEVLPSMSDYAASATPSAPPPSFVVIPPPPSVYVTSSRIAIAPQPALPQAITPQATTSQPATSPTPFPQTNSVPKPATPQVSASKASALKHATSSSPPKVVRFYEPPENKDDDFIRPKSIDELPDYVCDWAKLGPLYGYKPKPDEAKEVTTTLREALLNSKATLKRMSTWGSEGSSPAKRNRVQDEEEESDEDEYEYEDEDEDDFLAVELEHPVKRKRVREEEDESDEDDYPPAELERPVKKVKIGGSSSQAETIKPTNTVVAGPLSFSGSPKRKREDREEANNDSLPARSSTATNRFAKKAKIEAASEESKGCGVM
ncbi:hypothetical protein M422DRAFT_241832 [Sphaerobolus stellatus SS14]|nr:hypothetical protein M422DRAFT_241832 [Sphaerobolus stellatus SS14]